MKKVLISFLTIIALSASAQQVKPTKTQKEGVVLKKDGTPDKRYASSKKLKKDGTPDKRYKENKK